MRPTLRGEAMPMQRCEMRAAVTTWLRRVRAFRALGLWTCVAHLGSGAIRWLESDLRRKRPAKRQRCEHRPVASGRFFRRRPLSPCSFVQTFLQTLVQYYSFVQTFVHVRFTNVCTNVCSYKRWYRDRFQLPRRMAPALTNARDRTAPVVGKGRASNRAGAALPAPTSRVATGTGMVLHMDALGGVPKGVTTKMVIERADGLNVYVPCVTDSTCKSCTPTCRTTGSSW
jgi:hypothetical protein